MRIQLTALALVALCGCGQNTAAPPPPTPLDLRIASPSNGATWRDVIRRDGLTFAVVRGTGTPGANVRVQSNYHGVAGTVPVGADGTWIASAIVYERGSTTITARLTMGARVGPERRIVVRAP